MQENGGVRHNRTECARTPANMREGVRELLSDFGGKLWKWEMPQ
jgi:hypothetical protein